MLASDNPSRQEQGVFIISGLYLCSVVQSSQQRHLLWEHWPIAVLIQMNTAKKFQPWWCGYFAVVTRLFYPHRPPWYGISEILNVGCTGLPALLVNDWPLLSSLIQMLRNQKYGEVKINKTKARNKSINAWESVNLSSRVVVWFHLAQLHSWGAFIPFQHAHSPLFFYM